MKKKSQRKKFRIDIKTAFEIDKQLRVGLAENGLIPETDARDIRIQSVTSGDYEITLELEPSTAAALSQLLRKGIIGASAAHQANNDYVATSVGKIAKPKTKL